MTDFPKTIDFTAWLQAREGICVPEATIVIHSAFWHEGEGGKPDTQWPDKATFHLGINSTESQNVFAAMVDNAIGVHPKIKNRITVYNWISFAMLEQMEPHQYPHLRKRT